MKRICLLFVLSAFIVSGCVCSQKTPLADSPQKITASYLSDKGETLTAVFDTGEQSVELTLHEGRRIKLPVAVSGSGARYSDGKEVFWEHQGVGSYWVGERLVFQGKIKN